MCFLNPENYNQTDSNSYVSILVLMDVLLEFHYILDVLHVHIVSILVLMDVLLEFEATRVIISDPPVSILVLMDVLLECPHCGAEF